MTTVQIYRQCEQEVTLKLHSIACISPITSFQVMRRMRQKWFYKQNRDLSENSSSIDFCFEVHCRPYHWRRFRLWCSVNVSRCYSCWTNSQKHFKYYRSVRHLLPCKWFQCLIYGLLRELTCNKALGGRYQSFRC